MSDGQDEPTIHANSLIVVTYTLVAAGGGGLRVDVEAEHHAALLQFTSFGRLSSTGHSDLTLFLPAEHPDQRRGSMACPCLVRCIWLILIQAPSRLRRYWGYARETSKDP